MNNLAPTFFSKRSNSRTFAEMIRESIFINETKTKSDSFEIAKDINLLSYKATRKYETRKKTKALTTDNRN